MQWSPDSRRIGLLVQHAPPSSAGVTGIRSEVYEMDSELCRLYCLEAASSWSAGEEEGRPSGGGTGSPRMNSRRQEQPSKSSELLRRAKEFYCVSPPNLQIWEFAWDSESSQIAAVVRTVPYACLHQPS